MDKVEQPRSLRALAIGSLVAYTLHYVPGMLLTEHLKVPPKLPSNPDELIELSKGAPAEPPCERTPTADSLSDGAHKLAIVPATNPCSPSTGSGSTTSDEGDVRRPADIFDEIHRLIRSKRIANYKYIDIVEIGRQCANYRDHLRANIPPNQQDHFYTEMCTQARMLQHHYWSPGSRENPLHEILMVMMCCAGSAALAACTHISQFQLCAVPSMLQRNLLQDALPRMHDLRYLCVAQEEPDSRVNPLPTGPIQSAVQGMSKLRAFLTTAATPAILQQVVASCPRLETLIIGMSAVVDRDSDCLEDLSQLPQLQRLGFVGDTIRIDHILNGLQTCGANLIVLSMCGVVANDVHTMLQVARSCPQLQQLTFEPSIKQPLERYAALVEFPLLFGELRHVKLGHCSGEMTMWLLIASKKIESIEITLDMDPFVFTDHFIETVINFNPMVALQKFSVYSAQVLTATTALRLVQSCPTLSWLGHVGYWEGSSYEEWGQFRQWLVDENSQVRCP